MSSVECVREFRAMGSDCLLRVVAEHDPEVLVDRAIERLAELERHWTRFDDTSELAALNSAAGATVAVSPDTAEIIAMSIESWRATEGLFDPTMLDAIRSAGYDRTFDDLSDRESFDPSAELPARLPLVGDIAVDLPASTVRLPIGVQLDLGGIGKGRAADLLVEFLGGEGATGVCVDLGGDVRVAGGPIEGAGWGIVIDDPFTPGNDLALLALSDGAVATSSRLRRRWATSEGEAHHLLDPATGRPADTDLLTVTVLAASAAWAEVHAKAVLVAGSVDGVELLAQSGLSGLLVTDDGHLVRVGAIGDFLVDVADLDDVVDLDPLSTDERTR